MAGQPEPSLSQGPLYVFMDESGNLDFSDKGTDYFIVTALLTRDPLTIAQGISELKYALLAEGDSEVSFHAAENKQSVRDRVYSLINDSVAPVARAYTLYVDKHYAAPSLQNEVAMMALFGKAIARWLDNQLAPQPWPAVLAFDSVLTRRQQAAFKAEVKPALKSLGSGFSLTFQPVKEEPCGQVADYIAWAWSRKLERDDERPMAQLANLRQAHFNLFRHGRIKHY